MHTTRIFAAAIIAVFISVLAVGTASAHRDGCHRWHSCPSDTGSYVCGDLGNDTYCPKAQPAPATPVVSTAAPVQPVADVLNLDGKVGTVNRSSNIRSGPGTNFAVVAAGTAGQAVSIIGQNLDGSWYQLGDGQWIAAFLVDLEDAAPSSAAPQPDQPAPTEPAAAQLPYWRDANAATCGNFEWKVVDVRRPDGLWFYGDGAVKSNESFLVVYIEVKQVGTIAAPLIDIKPTIGGTYLPDWDASYNAAWMMTGGRNFPWEYFNPGQVITIAAAYDVPRNDAWSFGMDNCAGTKVNIGEWNALDKNALRANTN